MRIRAVEWLVRACAVCRRSQEKQETEGKDVSTIGIILNVLLGTAVGAAVGYTLGRAYGVEFGKASQWVDDYFASVNAERARHGADGKYINGRAKK